MKPAECVLHRLYGPTSAGMASQLPEVADHLHNALCTLAAAPDADACESLARDLHGTRVHVMRLAEALRRERGE